MSASRLCAGQGAEPTTAIIDSQSVKTTESGGVCGYDAGKKIKGRKRHIATDTQGNLLCSTVHTADIQNRDGAPWLIDQTWIFQWQVWPTLARLFADGGYAGWKLELALIQTMDTPPILEIVRRPNQASRLVVLAKRWVVERTFAWLGRCRSLAKDWEKSLASSNAWLTIAAIRRQSRFVARQLKSIT